MRDCIAACALKQECACHKSLKQQEHPGSTTRLKQYSTVYNNSSTGYAIVDLLMVGVFLSYIANGVGESLWLTP